MIGMSPSIPEILSYNLIRKFLDNFSREPAKYTPPGAIEPGPRHPRKRCTPVGCCSPISADTLAVPDFLGGSTGRLSGAAQKP